MRDLKISKLTQSFEKGLDRLNKSNGTPAYGDRVRRRIPRSPSLTGVSFSSEVARLSAQESPPAGVEEYKRGGRRRSRSGSSLATYAKNLESADVNKDNDVFSSTGEFLEFMVAIYLQQWYAELIFVSSLMT